MEKEDGYQDSGLYTLIREKVNKLLYSGRKKNYLDSSSKKWG